jgi:hypothetical protein
MQSRQLGSKQQTTITRSIMWISRRRITRVLDQVDQATRENLQLRDLAARLEAENSALRDVAGQLDAVVVDLSEQLWGRQAVRRVLDQARRSGNN